MSLAALLARRLCHDFAGPTGAIGTVVDMLGDGADPELVGLAADSSAALAAALELYRYVLTPVSEPVGGGRARTLVAAWLAARGDIVLDWVADDAPWPPGAAALTGGLAMVAADSAPRGTTLVVGCGSVSGSAVSAAIADALAGRGAATTPAALAAVLAELAAAAGAVITVSGDCITLDYRSGRLPR